MPPTASRRRNSNRRQKSWMNGSGSWISLLTEGSARKALVNATGEAVGAYPTGQAAPAFGCIVSEYTLDRQGILTGPRNARMLGIQNMREQCFLTAAVQNIKRLVASLLFLLSHTKPCILY